MFVALPEKLLQPTVLLTASGKIKMPYPGRDKSLCIILVPDEPLCKATPVCRFVLVMMFCDTSVFVLPESTEMPSCPLVEGVLAPEIVLPRTMAVSVYQTIIPPPYCT